MPFQRIEIGWGEEDMIYSKKDLIRKPITRFIVNLISLVCLIIGTRHWDYFHNWKGFVTIVIGAFFNILLINAYENLLEEKT